MTTTMQTSSLTSTRTGAGEWEEVHGEEPRIVLAPLPHVRGSLTATSPMVPGQSPAAIWAIPEVLDRWAAHHIWTRAVSLLARRVRQAEILVSDVAVARTLALLAALVFDDAPTPQIAVDTEGAIEIIWLVGGNMLALAVEDDGGSQLWAQAPNGRELFGGDCILPSGEMNEALVRRSAQFLAYMAPGVRTRAWYAQ